MGAVKNHTHRCVASFSGIANGVDPNPNGLGNSQAGEGGDALSRSRDHQSRFRAMRSIAGRQGLGNFVFIGLLKQGAIAGVSYGRLFVGRLGNGRFFTVGNEGHQMKQDVGFVIPIMKI